MPIGKVRVPTLRRCAGQGQGSQAPAFLGRPAFARVDPASSPRQPGPLQAYWLGLLHPGLNSIQPFVNQLEIPAKASAHFCRESVPLFAVEYPGDLGFELGHRVVDRSHFARGGAVVV